MQRLVRRQKASDIELIPTGDVIADRLQAAIAELAAEKATKSEVVDLTSDQNITGTKDFLNINAYDILVQRYLTVGQSAVIDKSLYAQNLAFNNGGSLKFAYINQNPHSFGIQAGKNGVGIPCNRLLGATSGRYLVTFTNINNGQALFDGVYGFQSQHPNPSQPAVVEIDYNPSLGWTPNSNSGYTYADGLLLISFYYNLIPDTISIELYNPTAGVDSWKTVYTTTDNVKNPLAIFLPNNLFTKKIRISGKHSNNITPCQFTEIEYFATGDSNNNAFSLIPKYSAADVDVALASLRFRDTSWAIKTRINQSGDSYFLGKIGFGTSTVPNAQAQISGGLVVTNSSTAAADPLAGNASVTGNITVGGNILKTLTWNTLTLVNAWLGTIQYAKLADGSVKLNGTLSRTTAPTNGQIIATLPTGFRPDRTYLFPAHNSNNNSKPYLQVDASGNLSYIEVGSLPGNVSNMSTASVLFNT